MNSERLKMSMLNGAKIVTLRKTYRIPKQMLRKAFEAVSITKSETNRLMPIEGQG